MSKAKYQIKVNSEDIIALRNNPFIADNRRAYWNDELEQDVKDLFNEGRGITEIAVLLQRTENSIVSKIKELELEKPIYKKHPKEDMPDDTDDTKATCEHCLCTECVDHDKCEQYLKKEE